jgi:crotonobetainyl-CoA:carnitine CoA-transferase CaiB-like acyl-CoA transferase
MVVELEHSIAGPVRMLGLPIHFSDTPTSIRLEPPALGADSEAVLLDLGYSPMEIAGWREAGVV